MLTASLPLVEPARLHAILGALRQKLINALLKSTGEFSDADRPDVIFAFAAEHPRQMFDVHSALRGEADF
jgi:hypothetical protein